MMINTIFLRRANKLIVSQGKRADRLPKVYLATAMKNVESLGYTFSHRLMHALRTLSKDQFAAFYRQLDADIRLLLGAHVQYQPMYPGFPEQVMQASDAQLYLNAIYHYLTLDLPAYERTSRPAFQNDEELKVIDLGSKDDFYAMIRQLIQAKTSISDTDRRYWSCC